MNPSGPTAQVRGARDLAALWCGLPAAVLAYPATAWSPEQGLARLSDRLRARAWRELCAAPTLQSCVERGCHCEQPGDCRADALFPMHLGGGAPSWRMATLFVQWRPTLAQWQLIALGQTACEALGWAARCLHEHHGLDGARALPVSTLADLQLPPASRWRLTFVTPWLVGKGAADREAAPDAPALTHELAKAMRLRAHKVAALCFEEERAQRLAGHLVHHVAEALLPGALSIESAEVEPVPLALASRGNRAQFTALTWTGQLVLCASAEVLPWLSLIALCGGGENADKGFGSLELIPLDSLNAEE